MTDEPHVARSVVGYVFASLPVVATALALVCGWSTWDRPAVFQGTALALPGPATSVTATHGGATSTLVLSEDRRSAWINIPPSWPRSSVELSVVLDSGSTVRVPVVVVPRYEGYACAVLGVLFVLGVFLAHKRASTMLSVGERWSLSRLQLLVWLCLTAAVLGASIPLLAAPQVDWSGALVLLTSGATAALSPLAGKPDSPDPKLDTMLSSVDSGLDISRVQHFCIVMLAAVLVAADFLHHLRTPQLSEGFVALLAASQAAYLGAKAANSRRAETKG